MPTETKDVHRFEQTIGAAIAEFKQQATAAQLSIVGVGIGVSSFVFADGIVDSTYGFMDFMDNYPLASRIKTQHNLACRLDNDARLVALGEAIYGQGKGFDRVLVLTLGTGLGLGFVVNGQLDGKLPFAHMAGHITVTTNKIRCYCGKTGCLESLVSATGIVAAAKRARWETKYPNLALDAATIFQEHERGNVEAQKIVASVVQHLKTGIQNYINLYAPDCIILGGGVAKGLKNYLPMLQNHTQLGPFTNYKTNVLLSELEEYAGILGSATLFNT